MPLSHMLPVNDDHSLWFNLNDDCTYVVHDDDIELAHEQVYQNKKITCHQLKFDSSCNIISPSGNYIGGLGIRDYGGISHWQITRSDDNIQVTPQSMNDFNGIYKVEAEFAKQYLCL